MERGADVKIQMSVLYGQDRRGVGVIQRVRGPYQLQGIQVQAHQVSAVVGDKQISFIDRRAGLHAEPVGLLIGPHTVVMPFDKAVRIDRDLPGSRIILRIEMHQIKNPVFPRPDQGIRLGVNQRRRVKEADRPPERERIRISEGILDAQINQADNERVGVSLIAVVSRAQIKKRISSRVQRAGSLEGKSQVKRIPGRLPCFQVQEIDITVHAGVDDFDHAVFRFGPVIHVHELFLFPGPHPHQRLPGPSAPGPERVLELQGARGNRPYILDAVLFYESIPVGRVIPEIVAAESEDSCRLPVILPVSETDFGRRSIGSCIFQRFPVDLNLCPGDLVGRIRRFRAVRGKGKLRLRGRFRLRCYGCICFCLSRGCRAPAVSAALSCASGLSS